MQHHRRTSLASTPSGGDFGWFYTYAYAWRFS
jgi:hypothetical protein